MNKLYLLALLVLSYGITRAHYPVINCQMQARSEKSVYKKTIFVTGAAGFIGSNFLKYMFDKYRDYYFLVLDCLTYAGNIQNIPDYIRNSERFEFWYGSITNSDMVGALMNRADFVVHFAAESHVARSIYDDNRFVHTDVVGTHVMLKNLVKNKHIERFIHISTSEVYGTARTKPMDEDHPLNSQSPYAAAKVGADRLVYSYGCTYDVPVVIIRPFNNYGPNQHLEKVIPRFITQAINKEPLKIHGDGTAQRDWIFVEDHCKAIDKVLHIAEFSKLKNQVINIGSGKATSVLEIARIILNYFKLPESFINFVSDRPGQVECHISSIEKAFNLLGWKAKTSVIDGVQKTIEWYVKHREWWSKIEWMKEVPIYTAQQKWEMQ